MYSRSSFKTINKITYVKPKKYAGKVPKSINIYFILNLCIFGFDFGYKKTLNKNFRLALSCIQLCVSIIMCVILNWRITLRTFDYYTALAFTIQYLAHNALLLLSKYNIYDLIVDVHSIDENIMEAVNTKLAIVLYLSTILNIGVKQTICVVNCLVDSAYYCETSFPGYWYCIPILGLDGITIIQMLLCYYVYRSVKYIRISLVNFDTKIVQERYHAVATYCDKIRPLNSAFVSKYRFCFRFQLWDIYIYPIACTPVLMPTGIKSSLNITKKDAIPKKTKKNLTPIKTFLRNFVPMLDYNAQFSYLIICNVIAGRRRIACVCT